MAAGAPAGTCTWLSSAGSATGVPKLMGTCEGRLGTLAVLGVVAQPASTSSNAANKAGRAQRGLLLS